MRILVAWSIVLLFVAALGGGAEKPARGDEAPLAPAAANPPAPWAAPLLPFGTARVLHALEKPPGRPAKEAVKRGLAWLAAHQCPDGHWSASAFMHWGHGKQIAPRTDGAAYLDGIDVGVTGLALLTFLTAGHAPLDGGPYSQTLTNGFTWLEAQQRDDGFIATHTGQSMLQAHAYATWAFVEVLGITGYGSYVQVTRRALAAIAKARNPYFAWRYGVKPGDNDTATTGDCVLPIYAARMIVDACRQRGVEPPFEINPEIFDGARAWMDKMTDQDYGRTGYIQRGGPSCRYKEGGGCDAFPAERFEGTTALGTLVRLWSPARDAKADEEQNRKACHLMTVTQLDWQRGHVDLYAWMYTSLALAQAACVDPKVVRSEQAWRRRLVETLVAAQCNGQDVAGAGGSWDPIDAWGWAAGRVYSTSAAILALLGPVRYAPASDARQQAKAIAEALDSVQLDPLRQVALLESLAALGVDRALRGAISKLLKRRPWQVRVAALEAIPKLDKPSKTLAKKAAAMARKDKEALVRGAALEALGALGPIGEAHADVFAAATAETSCIAFDHLAEALWASEALTQAARPGLEKRLADERTFFRVMAASVLYAHDPKHAKAREVLKANIHTEVATLRHALWKAVGWIAPRGIRMSEAQVRYAFDHDLPGVLEVPKDHVFVLIPPGTFRMGSPEDEHERLPDEASHEVVISKPYYLQIQEVTNHDYRAKVPKHVSRGYRGTELNGDAQPVLRVSHAQARAYADWLGAHSETHVFRLPTEAEWEYAARAGTTTRFWWGDDEALAAELDDVADASAHRVWKSGFGQIVESTPQWRWFQVDDGCVGTSRARDRKPNPWGLYAVHGNVGEWCLDWKGPYPTGERTDPRGPRNGTMHVYRGGSWVGSPQQCRSAMRGLLPVHLEPGEPCPWIGFRLVAEPK